MDLKCPEGHDFKMRFNSFSEGQRCRRCNLGIRQKQAKKLGEVCDKYRLSGDEIGNSEIWDIMEESMFSMLIMTKLKGAMKEKMKKLKNVSGNKARSLGRIRKMKDEDIKKYLEFISELVTEFPDIMDDNWGTIFDNIYINKIRKYVI